MGNDRRVGREIADMSLKSTQGQRVSVRVGVAAAAAVTALVGFSGPATALPSDQVVQFNPTLARIPGTGCAAIINAETVPQPQAGQLGVRVKIVQTGESCDVYRVSVRWKNLDTGVANAQSHKVDSNGVIEHAPDGVITGMGMAPGPGRVEATIVATTDTYPNHHDLEQLSGKAWITLNA
ncbi:hypothetical protein [Nocardia asteroides]|uniref:hypothetical protein n=1 Tax=Nocardia asteroides TaxID=1824 RepID=UPI0008E168D2|nr:hypothetical protein [Nocardia asteroides]UGT49644.1 hypothetical protein LT345_03250 [Nocardia asteroides]SFL97109.1 hypothetical protein SAMN05444423_1011577 [Nocardia asteroides]VEG37664.1 Uncharacterised protein [Nocardia asteroides]